MSGRVLVISQGAPGGIGRAEELLTEAMGSLAPQVKYDLAQKSDRPAYLGATPHPSAGGSRLKLAVLVVRLALRVRYDVVVVTHINLLPLAVVVQVLRPATRIVLVAFGIEVWQEPGMLSSLALRRVDRFWAISDYTAETMRAVMGLSQQRFRLMPLALNERQFAPLVSRAFETTPRDPSPTILSVTRLESSERYKGVDDVIEAVAHLVRRLPSAQYRVVGDGADRRRLMKLTQMHGVDDHVHFLGTLSEVELEAEYRRAWVFALPSAKEGFGFASLEAMATGLPVLGARAGATPELVTDGFSGLLVAYGEPEGLASALLRLLTDSPLRAQLGRNAQLTAAQRFGPIAFRARVGELIRDVSAF